MTPLPQLNSGYQPCPAEFEILLDVLKRLCRTRRLPREDAEDFCQWVHERMLRAEYRPFRLFDGRSSLRTYVRVCCERLLLDWRDQQLGKWRPSAAARSMGHLGPMLERLVYRDRLTPAEAFAHLESRTTLPADTRERLDQLLRREPRRSFVDHELVANSLGRCHDALALAEARAEEQRQLQVLDEAVRELSDEDRELLRARYWSNETVATFSKRRSIPPKMAYRRLGEVVKRLRSRMLVSQRLRTDTRAASSLSLCSQK